MLKFLYKYRLFFIACCVSSCDCGGGGTGGRTPTVSNPVTIPYHTPLYANSGETVKFFLTRKNEDIIETVTLYEQTQAFNSVTRQFDDPSPEVSLQTWVSPTVFPLEFDKSAPYPDQMMVTYIFEVKPENNASYRQRVSFATRGYPFVHSPIPVYATSDNDHAINITFLPDHDIIADIPRFINSVGADLTDGIFKEPYLQRLSGSYNFFVYITEAGVASRIPGTPHQLPLDLSDVINTSFIDVFSIIHPDELSWIDSYYELSKPTIGAGMSEKGTLLHELGHALYGLSDEYAPGGGHNYDPNKPNNWRNSADAAGYAPSVGLSTSDVNAIDGSTEWFKLCPDEYCQMRYGGDEIAHFDEPCKWGIYYTHYHRINGTWPVH